MASPMRSSPGSIMKDEAANIVISNNSIGTDANCAPLQLISDEDLSFVKLNIGLLPTYVRTKLKELETSFQEGEITEKGFKKKTSSLLLPHLKKLQNTAKTISEEYFEPPMNTLPKMVKEQLNELERELNEDEVTMKGYRRRRERILAPFMLKEPPLSTLPKSLQKDIDELLNEFEDGDLTEKGYKKRRAKLLSPYLIKANSWPADVNAVPGSKINLVTVFMRSGDRKHVDPDHAAGIQIMNGNEKLFKCQLCNEVFKQAQSFSGHCRLHRTGKTKAFKCNICKASYTTRSHLKFHMYKHTGNYPYNCEFCGKGFAGRSQYRYHTLRHSGQSPYICKECGGRFWKKRNLDVHCDKHRCDDAPAGFQKCAHCHAMFEGLDDLQSHMYEHDDEVEQEATMVSTKIKETTGSLSSNNSKSEDAMEQDIDDEEEVSEEGTDKDSEEEQDNNTPMTSSRGDIVAPLIERS